jgi:hypothetical protein
MAQNLSNREVMAQKRAEAPQKKKEKNKKTKYEHRNPIV